MVMQVKHALSKFERTRVVSSFGGWIEGYFNDGWKVYYVNFMFSPLRGNHDTIIRTMNDEVVRIYERVLPRVVRVPRSKKAKGKLPMLLGCPDLPVHKRDRKQPVRSFAINDGYHFNALVVVPPTSRLKQSLKTHFKERKNLYVGKGTKPYRIDVTRVRSRPRYMTGYTLKGIKFGTVSYDDLLVLPRGATEFIGSSQFSVLAQAEASSRSSFSMPKPRYRWGKKSDDKPRYCWGVRPEPGFSLREFRRDISQVREVYSRCGRSRGDIYRYLGVAHRMALRWQAASNPRAIFVAGRQFDPSNYSGDAKVNPYRLIIKLSAARATNKYQAKYVAALVYARHKGAKEVGVEEIMRSASIEIKKSGRRLRGLNACVALLKLSRKQGIAVPGELLNHK